MIHVVAVTGLRGAAVAATVVRDDAIAVIEEEQHLGVPIISRQRPSMTEHDRLAFAPVLIEDVDAILRRNRTHVTYSSFVAATRRPATIAGVFVVLYNFARSSARCMALDGHAMGVYGTT